MQAGINRLGKLFTDAGGFGDFIDTGAVELLQAAEVFQQVATALGADPGYVFQAGHTPGLATPSTVAIRLLLIDQVRCGVLAVVGAA